MTALIAFAAGIALTPLVRWAALRFGLLDHPNERSSHTRATPRGGGIAVLAAVLVALAAAPSPLTREGVVILVGGVAMALLGIGDDRFDLPAGSRLIVQVLIATAVAWHLGGLPLLPLPPPLDFPVGALAVPLAVFWMVAVVNLYNFMDGIDGLAGLQGVVTGAGIALMGWHPFASSMGAATAGACLAFLLFNWSPARLFLGDVGSLFLGYTFASLPLLAPLEERGGSVWLAAISMWFFLADATWTRLRLTVRGRPWSKPHKEHAYQRLVASGWSHARTALVLGIAAASLTLIALAARPNPGAAWGVLGLASLLYVAETALVGRRTARP